MPLIVLSEPEATAAAKDVDADLKWVLSDNDVPDDIQLVLHHFGVKRLKGFSGLVDEASDLRTMIKDQLGINPLDSMLERSRAASVVASAVRRTRPPPRRGRRAWFPRTKTPAGFT